MTAFVQTMGIAVILVLVFVGYVALFAHVCLKLKQLMGLVMGKRADRKILKTAERCRRDFA